MGQCLGCGGGAKEESRQQQAPQSEMAGKQSPPQSSRAERKEDQPEEKKQPDHGGKPHGGGKVVHAEASTAGDAQRAQAGVHAKRRGELMSQSKASYTAGDKAAAKKLSDEGKAEGLLMDACNLAACEAYFAGNNKGKGQGEIDLHGLYIEEAIRKLEARLEECKRDRLPQLIVIVGRGNHSVANVALIKPKIQELIKERKYKHENDMAGDVANAGCITIHFDH